MNRLSLKHLPDSIQKENDEFFIHQCHFFRRTVWCDIAGKGKDYISKRTEEL